MDDFLVRTEPCCEDCDQKETKYGGQWSLDPPETTCPGDDGDCPYHRDYVEMCEAADLIAGIVKRIHDVERRTYIAAACADGFCDAYPRGWFEPEWFERLCGVREKVSA